MPFSNTLAPVSDVPVWEWMRSSPVTSSTLSEASVAIDGRSRYMYYRVNSVMYRYDTQTDGWQQLKSIVGNAGQTGASAQPAGTVYRREDGIFGTIISASSNTVSCMAMDGKICIGNVIRIIDGKGAGQERMIVSATDPIAVDTMTTDGLGQGTADKNGSQDSKKKWKNNQWRGYQYRVMFSGFAGTCRPVIWNDADSICTADGLAVPWFPHICYGTNRMPGGDETAMATNMNVVIEYSILTLDKPWDVVPDNFSRYVIKTGGVYQLGINNHAMSYYDVAADTWFQKRSFTGNFLRGNNNTGETSCIDMYSGSYDSSSCATYYATGTIDAYVSTNNWSTRSVIVYGGTGSMIDNQYAWYRFRQSHGTDEVILSNNSSSFTMVRDFRVTGSAGDTFAVCPDYDKLWMGGFGETGMYQYSTENDTWMMAPRYDYGYQSNLVAFPASNPSMVVPILIISKSSTVGLLTSSIPMMFKDGDLITIRGALGADGPAFNATNVVFTASKYSDTQQTAFATPQYGTYMLPGVPSGPSASFSSSTVQTMSDASKNWQPGEHVGRVLMIWGFTPTAGSPINTSGWAVSTQLQCSSIVGNSSTQIYIKDGWISGFTSGSQSFGQWHGYNIVDLAAFGSARTKGTGSMYFSGSISGSTNPFIYFVSGTLGFQPEMLQPGFMVTGSGIPPFTFIRGIDMFRTPTSMSITQAASASGGVTASIFTCSLDSQSGFGTHKGASGTSITDSDKVWPTGFWTNAVKRLIAGTGNPVDVVQAANSFNTASNGGTTVDTSSIYSIQPINRAAVGYGQCWVAKSNIRGNSGRYIYRFEGGATNRVYAYNINTNQWEYVTVNGGFNLDVASSGSNYCYDGDTKIYIEKDTSTKILMFDTDNHKCDVFCPIPFDAGILVGQSGGRKLFLAQTEEGIKYLYYLRQASTEMYRCCIPPFRNQ